MRYWLTGFISSLLTTTAFSLPVITGMYGGLSATGSRILPDLKVATLDRPSSPTISYPLSNHPPLVSFKHDPLGSLGSLKSQFGVGGGAQLGYRFTCFRVEGQLLYNYNSAKKLNFDTVSFNTDKFKGLYYLAGSTQEYAGFVNFYYDLRELQSNEASFSPYVGVGVGYAKFSTIINFAIPSTPTAIVTGPPYVPNTRTELTATEPVGQAIIGVNMAMDSYMDFFLDGRYLVTRNMPVYRNSFRMATINFGMNFILDGGSHP